MRTVVLAIALLAACSFTTLASNGKDDSAGAPPSKPMPRSIEGEVMEGVTTDIGAGFEIADAPEILRKKLVGTDGPIRYLARVEKGGAYVVVLGFFETFYARAGQRVMDVQIEGASSRRVDVAAEAGRKRPYAIAIEAQDADGDGWIEIVVGPHADARDRSPTLAAVWVFAAEEWQTRSLTAERVLAGEIDADALHVVDCGAVESLGIRLWFAKRLARAEEAVSGLEAVASRHPEAGVYVSSAGARLRAAVGRLRDLSSAGEYDELAVAYGAFAEELSDTQTRVSDRLARAYLPALRQPAQTHLSSPWGALIRVRQEDQLRMQLELLPRPESLEHKYHPQYARRDPLGWIEIATSAKARQDSTSLGLEYDLGLQGIDYDPLTTRYRYQEGDVRVDIMDVAAVRVWSPTLRLKVGLNTERVEAGEGMLRGVVSSVHESQIHYAVLLHDVAGGTANEEAIECAGMTIVWADSADELQRLAGGLRDWAASQAAAASWRVAGTQAGRVHGPANLVRRADMDRRTFLSMVYQFGGTYAALDGSYEAIWVRDTTNVVVAAALAGDPKYLRRWTPYLLANPTPAELGGREYETFIIAPYDGEHIFKMEDDGPFYAVLSTYAYWKLCDEGAGQLPEWYETLTSAIDFVTAKSYDERLGLYSEALINEAPLKDSPYWKDEKAPRLKIGDDWPMRVHSIYVNNLMYGAHLMMGEMAAAMGKSGDAATHFRKAQELANAIDARLWNTSAGRYWAGLAVMDTGELIPVDYDYSDIFFDYPWAFSLYTLTPHGLRDLRSTESLMGTWLVDPPLDRGNAHVTIPYGHSACIYAWAGLYERARQCVDYVAGLSEYVGYNPTMQAVYAMRGAMPEWNVLVHCHRPQVFAAGPCLQGIVSLGAAVDFNGISVTPSGQLDHIEDLRFRGSVIDFDLGGGPEAVGLVVDGVEVRHTLRIPSPLLSEGEHTVRFMRGGGQAAGPLLVRTNLELRAVDRRADGAVQYTLTGFGNGTVRLAHVDGRPMGLYDRHGDEVPFDHWPMQTGDWLRIPMAGEPVRLVVGGDGSLGTE